MAQRKSMQQRIFDILIEEHPGLLVADPEASARATGELACVMGCAMSYIMGKKGMPTYREALKIVVQKIHDNAIATVNKASEMAGGNEDKVN